jgi:hypothetical protein
MQGNPGVNPSFSILALAEYAIDQIPSKNRRPDKSLESLVNQKHNTKSNE